MKKYTGVFVLGTLFLYLASRSLPALAIPASVLAWLVVILQWTSFGKSQVNQAILLLALGVFAILFAAFHGVVPGLQQIFMVNLPLLAMFVAVSFLSLTNPGYSDEELPRGKIAAVTTAAGTNLLGAVINLSILFVFGDRLQRNNTLTRAQMVILARSFCAAAWWSPFFIATGVALTYAPEMQWQETVKPGVLMCCIALFYSVVEITFVRKVEFRGYPLKLESMIIPVILAAAVICIHNFRTDISILNIICVIAPAGALLFMRGKPKVAVLRDFVSNRINSVSSQFMLFLAAGVFSTGIKAITQVYPALFNFDGLTFSPFMFAAVSGVLIISGLIGVPPLVGISIISPLILPLNPNHSQLGFMFLTSWAISTGSSPLSGVGLVLVSRYHASPRAVIKYNYHYAFFMWLLSSVLSSLYFG